MEDSYQSPPIVMDTNVLVAGACRFKSSWAHQLLMGVLEATFPIILTEPLVLEYLDALARPSVRALTGLNRHQAEELVTGLISLSRKMQLRFSWRPDLRGEGGDKFVIAAIHTAAVVVTYHVSDFRSAELAPHGWTLMTPQDFFARYQ